MGDLGIVRGGGVGDLGIGSLARDFHIGFDPDYEFN